MSSQENLGNESDDSNSIQVIDVIGTQKTSTFKPRSGFLEPSSDEDSLDELLSQAKATLAASSSSRVPKSSSLVPAKTTKPAVSSVAAKNPKPAAAVSCRPKENPAGAAAKSRAAQLREEERTRKRQEAEAAKISRKEKREREKQERDLEREQMRLAKKRQTQQEQQEAGRYANKEIVLLLDPVLNRDYEYDIPTSLEGQDLSVQEYPSVITSGKALQWIRKNYIDGGAEEAWKCLQQGKSDEYELLPYLVVILEPDDYIPLIQRTQHDVDDDYPVLGEYLEQLKRRWHQVWGTQDDPRIVLLLHGISVELDRRWLEHRRAKDTTSTTTTSPPNEWELQDSIQWMLIQFQVECVQCSSIEDIQTNVKGFTVQLAGAPYVKQVTEVECIRKIKQDIGLSEDPLSQSRDIWLRQLQMIPGVSEGRARNLIQHYPTLQSLWQAYQDLEGDSQACANLLTRCFDDKTRAPQLSAKVYKIVTCTDPNLAV